MLDTSKLGKGANCGVGNQGCRWGRGTATVGRLLRVTLEQAASSSNAATIPNLNPRTASNMDLTFLW